MTVQHDERDLIVVVADEDMRQVMLGVLGRIGEIGSPPLTFTVNRHPGRDAGCRTKASTYMRPYLKRFRHGLIMFDRHGCGSRASRDDIQRTVQRDLEHNGWGDRAKAIVIDPELEAWIWGDLKAAAACLGWASDDGLRRWLAERALWPRGNAKPDDPKEAMKAAIHGRRRLSPRIFQAIAESAHFGDCRDAAFNELHSTLGRWFPASLALLA